MRRASIARRVGGAPAAAALAGILALAAAGCASSPRLRGTAKVPDRLKPPAGESLVMVAAARGVQIYECREKKDQAGAYEWAFVAPEADLFDAGGRRIGRHYAGPTWESSDGSKVQGTV